MAYSIARPATIASQPGSSIQAEKSVSADQVRGFEPVAGKYSPRLTIRLLNDDMQRHEQSFTADKELIPW
ncbi:MAG TPA: hypothetical protein VK148_21545, partial [Xanthobacteraceae bacterium]|nr:hypothetical protein [Xanthobacteraceae bacterium]